jgi:hypothetical protein
MFPRIIDGGGALSSGLGVGGMLHWDRLTSTEMFSGKIKMKDEYESGDRRSQ